MEGHDLLGIAQTGTGKPQRLPFRCCTPFKTKGYALQRSAPLALILAPTRELASQIFEDIRQYSQETSIRATCIFGGANQNPQIRRLEKGAEILVATPGRLMDLEAQGFLSLSAVQYLVLTKLIDCSTWGLLATSEKSRPCSRRTVKRRSSRNHVKGDSCAVSIPAQSTTASVCDAKASRGRQNHSAQVGCADRKNKKHCINC